METNKKEKTLPGYYIPAWSAQAVSYAIAFVVLGYITYYCTNSLGLSPGLVGGLLLVSKLFDGLTDLVAAVVIERTNTRWGKGRPYVLMMIAAWISIILMFSTPNFGTVGKAFYIFVTYFLANSVFITFVNAADPVCMARSLKNTDDSSTVLAMSGLITAVATAIIGIIFPLLITNVSVTPHGWTKISFMLGVPCMLLSYIRFALIKENTNVRVGDVKKEKKFGFRDMLKVLAANPHVIVLIVVQVFANIFSGLNSAVGTYYFQYIMGDINLASIVAFTTIIGMLSLVFCPALIKKTSVKKVMVMGIALGILGNLLRIVPSMPVLLLGNLLTSIAAVPTGMLLPSLLLDCMDYHEWKSGERVEGIFGAMNAFATKIGGGLASVIVGIVMGLTGFDADLEVQSQITNYGIIALYAVLPAALFIIMFVSMRKYTIDQEMPIVKKELAERKNIVS